MTTYQRDVSDRKSQTKKKKMSILVGSEFSRQWNFVTFTIAVRKINIPHEYIYTKHSGAAFIDLFNDSVMDLHSNIFGRCCA